MAVRTFLLPDLGEGLQEAEIVDWHVKEGDRVRTDQPLAAVETAKAVVDVPAPWSGRIAKIHAQAGTILKTHAPLVDIEEEGAAEPARPAPQAPTAATEGDSGTVVGRMPAAGGDLEETMIVRRRTAPPPPVAPAVPRPPQAASRPSPTAPRAAEPTAAPTTHGPVKALPRVRRLARERGIDLAIVRGSGPRGAVTLRDLEAAPPPLAAAASSPVTNATGAQPQRGPRRAMAQTMSLARDTIAATTLFDDADIDAWDKDEDITVRVVRAIAAAVRDVPILNAWYDGEALALTVHPRLDLGLAVDTPDGLIVPVVRDAGALDRRALRARLDDIKVRTRARRIDPEDLRAPTLTLSNFGMMAGRYATPVVVPPTVAIVGTGRLCHDVVPVLGGVACHRRLPLSVTFDHRAVTGGDACRFLAAMIRDLERRD